MIVSKYLALETFASTYMYANYNLLQIRLFLKQLKLLVTIQHIFAYSLRNITKYIVLNSKLCLIKSNSQQILYLIKLFINVGIQ